MNDPDRLLDFIQQVVGLHARLMTLETDSGDSGTGELVSAPNGPRNDVRKRDIECVEEAVLPEAKRQEIQRESLLLPSGGDEKSDSGKEVVTGSPGGNGNHVREDLCLIKPEG